MQNVSLLQNSLWHTLPVETAKVELHKVYNDSLSSCYEEMFV